MSRKRLDNGLNMAGQEPMPHDECRCQVPDSAVCCQVAHCTIAGVQNCFECRFGTE
jgi:hypothetical protein